MKPTLLLSALLALPLCAQAAPADKPAAPPSAAPPMMEGHSADDGHDHGQPKANEGSLTDYLWRRSDAAFHEGDYPRAIELHRAIVTVNPTDVESFGVGAWLLWSMDKRADADAFIAQGLKANPDNAEMWDAAGKQYGLEKDYSSERDAYAKAVELSGKEADQMLRRRLAHASEKAGDLNGSARVWRGLVADFPNEAVNKNNLARLESAIADKDGVKTMGALGLGALALLSFAAWKKRQSRAL